MGYELPRDHWEGISSNERSISRDSSSLFYSSGVFDEAAARTEAEVDELVKSLRPDERLRFGAAIRKLVKEHSEEALQRAESRMQLAQEVGRIGCFEIDMRDGTSVGTPSFFELYGLSGDRGSWSHQEWLSFVHPDDRAGVLERLHRVALGEELTSLEYRIVRTDGEVRWTTSRARLEASTGTRPVRAYGIQQDVTERKLAELALAESEASLGTLFRQALVGMAKLGRRGDILMANPRFCEMLGRSEAELVGHSLADYTHPDDLAWNVPLVRKHARTGEPFEIQKRYVRSDGEIVWCRVSISFAFNAHGRVDSLIVVADDITRKLVAEDALRESEMLHRSILEASADCIKIISLDGTVEFMNMAGISAMELESADEVVGRPWSELWPEEARPMILAALEAAGAGDNIRCSGVCPTAKGARKWWDLSVTPMRDPEGSVVRILAISRDVTLQRKTAERLQWASEHDALTELPNRRAFESHLQAATIRAMQGSSKVGLLLLDLDHFKHVNDTLGHAAGDHLLTVFGKRLKECIRASDFVARLGGDEFAVILEGDEQSLDLPGAGSSFLARLQDPILYDGRVMSASASIGGALFPNDASSANELFKNADIALYALKQSGRGGTRMFHQHMREQSQLVSSQLSLARSAVTRKSVEPHYQQKIELGTGRIAGFEALLRWRHPTRGIQHPETVAEAFKDYELASKIGDLMQRRVFSDVRGWLNRGLPLGFVAVNAAPAEFLRDDFAERLCARMEEHQIAPALVEIEVTEHVFLERGSDYVGRALKLLASKGVRIALDDFGTGYSSLSHLRDYPVHVVKIDKTFVEKIATDPSIRAIVSAVVNLAKSLKIEVVAEGVESEEQRQVLLTEGCHMAQGYLFGRAIEADEVPSLLAGRPRRLRVA
jgi:diguanylate cyclase (GGDEF)-like protein/PAS domain S-box-containing protein